MTLNQNGAGSFGNLSETKVQVPECASNLWNSHRLTVIRYSTPQSKTIEVKIPTQAKEGLNGPPRLAEWRRYPHPLGVVSDSNGVVALAPPGLWVYWS